MKGYEFLTFLLSGYCDQRSVVRVLLSLCDLSGPVLPYQSCLGCCFAVVRTRNCCAAGRRAQGEWSSLVCLTFIQAFLGWREVLAIPCSQVWAVFSWLSKIIRVYFGFALLRSVIGWQNSRHFLNQWEAKRKPWLARTRFPALGACYMYFLRILIGSLRYLRLLGLVRVITFVSFTR